jgi:hypothetical protein
MSEIRICAVCGRPEYYGPAGIEPEGFMARLLSSTSTIALVSNSPRSFLPAPSSFWMDLETGCVSLEPIWSMSA